MPVGKKNDQILTWIIASLWTMSCLIVTRVIPESLNYMLTRIIYFTPLLTTIYHRKKLMAYKSDSNYRQIWSNTKMKTKHCVPKPGKTNQESQNPTKQGIIQALDPYE